MVVAGVLAGGVATAGAATLPTLSISLGPKSIAVSGPTQSGAVNVVATATGGLKEPSVTLFALKPGATAAELLAYIGNKHSDPNGVGKIGTIVFGNEARPGKGSEAQTVLTPGNYVALYLGEEGEPIAHTEFTVTPSPSPAALPAPEATETSIEFGFRGPTTLHNGELVRFENEGFLVHMIFAVPVRSRAAAKKFTRALIAGKEHQAFRMVAGQPLAWLTPVSSGAFQQTTITAKPGIYVEVCFMETQDGRDHTRLGMERTIRITK
ncbi:MAG TPA: hypothetical protein VFW29_07670 [Solirubrobacteraceae bacterium]|nr:hypothetical protein [Solirubrobacteraceae bacterium]